MMTKRGLGEAHIINGVTCYGPPNMCYGVDQCGPGKQSLDSQGRDFCTDPSAGEMQFIPQTPWLYGGLAVLLLLLFGGGR